MPLVHMLDEAQAHLGAGRLDDAGHLYQAIVAQQPGHPEAHHGLGLIALGQHRVAEAIGHLRTTLQGEPTLARNWLFYLEALIQGGQAGSALEVLAQGRDHGLEGPEADALEQRARHLARVQEATILAAEHFHAGRYEASLDCFHLILRYQPANGPMHNNMGSALFRLGRLEEAENSFRRAVDLTPDYALAHYNLGTVLMEFGRVEAAMECFRHALRLSPEYDLAHENLDVAMLLQSRRLVEAGRVDEAVDLLVDHEFRWTAVNIEVSTHCNLKCVNCQRTIEVAHDRWDNRHMSPETFRKVIGNIPPTQMCHLTWLGEPTLNPALPELVDIARESGRFRLIRLTTNALARDAGYYRDLVARGVEHILISADSFTPAIVRQTRPGTNVKKLLTRIAELKGIAPMVGISYTLSRINIADFEHTLAELDRIGGVTVVVDFLSDFSETSDHRIVADDLAHLRKMADEAAARYPNIGIQIMAYQSERYPVAHSEYCNTILTAPAITVDGMYAPCCMWREERFIGGLDLAAMTFREAKHSPAFREFIRSFIQRRPDFCSRCSQNVRTLEDVVSPA